MRIALLCDGHSLARWQRAAVERIAGDHELLLLVARSAPPARRSVRHAAYYALNLVTVRNRQTRREPFPNAALSGLPRHEFDPDRDGWWAALPEATIDWLVAERIDVVVKFALDLLRIPPLERLPVPILSFHHGDPSAFRGRPAGFHELAGGARFIGQIVQILSNRIDSGDVLAFAESRVHRDSYRRTLVEAYELSPFLLPKALAALARGTRVSRPATGPNYRLPSTFAVVRLIARMAGAAAKRLGYGAAVEKRWRVAHLPLDDANDPLASLAAAERRPDRWTMPPLGPAHRFHADPFFLADGSVLVEALSRRTGKGQLLRIDEERQTEWTDGSRHYSYPCPFEGLLIPEIESWSPPTAYRADGDRLERAFRLDIDVERLIDPTLLAHDGRVYLFGNDARDGTSVLHLWSAAAIDQRFERHPASPIRLSARGSRMAGRLHRCDRGLIRFGQDWRGGYGDGLLAFRTLDLSPTTYAEEEIGSFAFSEVRGPHTIDLQGGRLLFDFYRDQFDPLAGLRRLKAKI